MLECRGHISYIFQSSYSVSQKQVSFNIFCNRKTWFCTKQFKNHLESFPKICFADSLGETIGCFLTDSAQKLLSVKCQNLLTDWHLEIRKTPRRFSFVLGHPVDVCEVLLHHCHHGWTPRDAGPAPKKKRRRVEERRRFARYQLTTLMRG